MLSTIYNRISLAIHGKTTLQKELDVVIDRVERWDIGHKYDHVTITSPVYYLGLRCLEAPHEKKISERTVRSCMPEFSAIIGADQLTDDIVSQLAIGTQIAVKGNLCEDGKGWGTSFVTDCFDLVYELSDLKIGKATNPVNPTDLLVPVSYTSVSGAQCSP